MWRMQMYYVEWRRKGLSYTEKRMNANWIGHILRRNCLLKHIIKGKIVERIGVTGKRGRKHRQLLDDLKEERICWKLTVEPLDRTLWRNGFESGYRPAVRDYGVSEWMNVLVYNKLCILRFSNVLQLRMRKHFVGSQLSTPLVEHWMVLFPRRH
jgi:hypothetical protein